MDSILPYDFHENRLPERPRLRSGCRLFQDASGFILRSSRYAHRLDPAHGEAFLRVLSKLDGTHDFTALLEGERADDAFHAMRMIALLNYRGMIAEGPQREQPQPLTGIEGSIRLDEISLILPRSGAVSDALAHRLHTLGAVIQRGDLAASGEMSSAIHIVCPNGPDLAMLETFNQTAVESRTPWLPVFPFGDVIILGPLFQPPICPCFRCFELRWLGISPSIALERAYFEHLRSGGWADEALTSRHEAEQFADLVAPGVAASIAGLESHLILIRTESHSISTARLEHHPGCEVCRDGRDADRTTPSALDLTHWLEPAVALGDVRRMVLPLADTLCGLASVVIPPGGRVRIQGPGSPEVVVARFALPDPEDVYGEQDNWTHGSAASVEDAQTLAIIEAFERYNGLSRPSHELRASFASVADRATLPTELPLFSARQYAQPGFPFQPFDPGQELRWSWGYNLTRRTPVLVPTTAAWYGQDDSLLGETSSGVAAHSSRGLALLNGALEIVERDAFMIHWLHRISPPLVDLAQLHNTVCSTLIRQIEQSGYAARVADLTTDLGIPAFLAVGFREDRQRPALLVGAGASLDPVAGVTRALKELSAATLNETDLWVLKSPLAPDEIVQLEDHRRAYEHPAWLAMASFLWTGTRRSSLQPLDAPADPLAQLIALMDRLGEHGHDLIGVDITGADVARHGLRVVRAIVPGLQPLGFGRRIRLGGRRLYEAPQRMGYQNAPAREDDLYMVPHCFP